MTEIHIPVFLQGETLPNGYYDVQDPYATLPRSKYNLRAMVNYAKSIGKEVTELSKEEAEKFLIH